jgi:hypothetical protein
MKIKDGEYHEEDAVDEEPVRIEPVSVLVQSCKMGCESRATYKQQSPSCMNNRTL